MTITFETSVTNGKAVFPRYKINYSDRSKLVYTENEKDNLCAYLDSIQTTYTITELEQNETAILSCEGKWFDTNQELIEYLNTI